MTSSRLAITDFLLLEYNYSSGVSLSSEFDYSVVRSADDNYTQIIENTNKTGNNVDLEHSVVQVGTTPRFAGKSIGSLESEHSNTLLVNKYSFLRSTTIPMNTVRLYLKSGYTFTEDIKGFLLEVALRDENGGKFKLCHFKFTKEDYSLIRYPKTPIIISEVVYDSYLEIRVPAPVYVSTGSMPYAQDLSLGTLERNIYISISTITKEVISPANTGVSYEIGDTKSVVLSDIEPVSSVTANLLEKNGYFEYFGNTTLPDYSFEDYIYEIMGTGVNLMITHTLDVYEHTDGENVLTSSITTLQTSNFHKNFKFKPILEYPDVLRAISVDYTMNILNTKTGHSIVKSASLTTEKIGNFKNTSTTLRLSGDVYSHKLYLPKNETTSVNLSQKPTQKPGSVITPIYINVNIIDMLTKEESHITINPGFTTNHKFTLVNKQDDMIKPVELDSINNYYMVFFGADDKKLFIPESKLSGISRTSGELLFSIPENVSSSLSSATNHKFYIVSKSPSVADTVLTQGTWELK